MTRRDARVLLWDIAEHGGLAIGFLGAMTLDEYRSDARTRSAVEREIMIVGEAMGALDRAAPGMTSRMPAAVREVVGLRNVLAHAYGEVVDADVFETVRDDLPGLVRAAEELLRGGPSSASTC
jgi:uncharacterized protein with HEPN domain